MRPLDRLRISARGSDAAQPPQLDEGSAHSAVLRGSEGLALDLQPKYMDPSSAVCASRRPRFLRMTERRYCFFASNLDFWPRRRSLLSSVIFVPSAETVMREIAMALPSRLSVSSMVLASIFLRDTLVVPGSPLYG